MNTFANAVKNQGARTANGMKAKKNSAHPVVDLFYKVGASRGQDIIPDFVAAFVDNADHALRVMAWARDVRGGAGERELFRSVLRYLENSDPNAASRLAAKAPELGRWDDLLVFETKPLKAFAYGLIRTALESGNGLCAKWMPRKGAVAAELRNFLGLSPKGYRKMLVGLTQVVETQMCNNEWEGINFNHVPSLASTRYKKAFYRHTPKFAEYVAALTRGDEGVKVNAGAVYPYDLVKGMYGYGATEKAHLDAQWKALPNYVGDASVFPMVDVSGSMTCSAGNNPNLTCMDVAVSLGMYLAEKNTGAFKDMFLTFSEQPEILTLKGTVSQRYSQLSRSHWGMNTNLVSAFEKILSVAKSGNVPRENMPQTLLILSDMQFDQCVRFDDSAYKSMVRQFEKAGYDIPNVVFWNLHAYSNSPVSFDTRGVAMVSGFSPAIMKSILANDLEQFTPESVMLKTIMDDRYTA